jgi:HSP20 family protein
MAKTEWDPLKELVGVQERMNKLFESALAKTNFDADGGVGAWAPVTDVYETADQLILCLELPGLDQKDIDLRMDGDELVVQGERRLEKEEAGEQFHRVEQSYGRFVRRFPIPSTIDRDSVDALYRAGVLKVSLRKKGDGQRNPVRVEIR